jgi:hypothetical protein
MLSFAELGEATTLYTTDPPMVLAWGGLRNVYHAVDFGPERSVWRAFALQRLANVFLRKSPPFNSEFYTGWFTAWGQPIVNKCVISPPGRKRFFLQGPGCKSRCLPIHRIADVCFPCALVMPGQSALARMSCTQRLISMNTNLASCAKSSYLGWLMQRV